MRRHSLGRLILRRRRRRLSLRRSLLIDLLIIVIDLQPDLASDPAEHALLLQLKVNQSFVSSPPELCPVELHSAEEMVLPSDSAAIEHLLIVVDFDFKFFVFHGGRICDDEFELLIPYWIQISVFR
ncbi:hypothetical protein Syun_020899 [Stephania yunnanensis]|uniref:Uncharacterized protein n=1 Tax=Stephania yunnanensis TaxID=152371 RepID=A0AAP0IF18_9MAGN